MISNSRLNVILSEEISKASSVGLDMYFTYPEVIIGRRKKSYGVCHRSGGFRDGVRCRIEISKYYLSTPNVTEDDIRTVICHEVCHTVKGSAGHDTKWKRAVRKMRRAYSYKDAEYHLSENPYSNHRRGENHVGMNYTHKYTLKCTHCGVIVYRDRMCGIVKNPMMYTHGDCKGMFELV